MIVEIITTYALLQCINVLTRSVGRRRDVLYYVEHWEAG
jgi:hypothetical protein